MNYEKLTKKELIELVIAFSDKNAELTDINSELRYKLEQIEDNKFQRPDWLEHREYLQRNSL